MRNKIGFIFQDVGVFFARHNCDSLALFFAKCEAVANPNNVEK